jgi:beta-glucanase (GH16 family)
VLAGTVLLLALVIGIVSGPGNGTPHQAAAQDQARSALPGTCTQFAQMVGKCGGATTTTTTTAPAPAPASSRATGGETYYYTSGGGAPASAPSSGSPAATAPAPANSPAAAASNGPAGACAGAAPPMAAPTGSWTCTLDDEFNGTSLDTTKWSPMLTYGSDYRTGTAQNQVCYVNNPNTVSESGGTLNLSIVQTSPFACQGTINSYHTQYQGGMIISYHKFSQLYGYFEVRAAMPPTSIPGLQETLWLFPEQEGLYGPGDDSGEIDYGEFYSEYPNLDIPVVHYPGSQNDPNSTTDTCSSAGHTTVGQFNTYALLWTPTTLTTYYNGTPCMTDVYAPYVTNPDTAPEPFNQPFFLAFTAALGLDHGNAFQPGETPLPATTQIDYVRVWQFGS